MKHLALLALAVSAGQPEARPEPEPLAEAITVAETRAEDGTFTLVHETVVEAPAVEVWQAISTADGWRTWAAPVARAPEPDAIETSYTPSAAPGDASTNRQQVLSRIPGRTFVFRTVKAPAGFPNFDTYRLVVSTFELEPLDQTRTRVRLTCSGYPDSEAGRQLLGFFREGNRTSLEQLRQRFISGPIDWTRQR